MFTTLVKFGKDESWDADEKLGNKESEIKAWFEADEPDHPAFELKGPQLPEWSYIDGARASSGANLRSPGTFLCYMGPDFRRTEGS